MGCPWGTRSVFTRAFPPPTYMYMQGCSYKKAKPAFLLHTSLFFSTAHKQSSHCLVLQSNLSQNEDLFWQAFSDIPVLIHKDTDTP